MISGAALAAVGVLGAGYMVMNMLLPAWNEYSQLQGSVSEKETQIQQQENSLKSIEELEQALRQEQVQQQEILSLFASEKNLNTLLLDLNRFIEARQAELISFQPVDTRASLVEDGSLGAEVNGKLKRQSLKMEVEGTFEQTQSIMRSIERLQSLLLVKDFRAEITEPPSFLFDQGKLIPQGEPKLKISFQLDALSPLSPEEKAKQLEEAEAAEAEAQEAQ
ncbi:MAG: hypothetical protein ACOC3E_00060 [Cyanobacteriota bacterium]